MTPDRRDELIEATLSAHRERTRDGALIPSPAWADLPPADREAAYETQVQARRLESTIDPFGLNATMRAVLRRVEGMEQLRP